MEYHKHFTVHQSHHIYTHHHHHYTSIHHIHTHIHHIHHIHTPITHTFIHPSHPHTITRSPPRLRRPTRTCKGSCVRAARRTSTSNCSLHTQSCRQQNRIRLSRLFHWMLWMKYAFGCFSLIVLC